MSSATKERKCIGCGCTDNRACEGGCYWVDGVPDLCSACVLASEPSGIFSRSMADDDLTLEKIETGLEESVAAGHMEIAGISDDGKQMYRLTEAGERYVVTALAELIARGDVEVFRADDGEDRLRITEKGRRRLSSLCRFCATAEVEAIGAACGDCELAPCASCGHQVGEHYAAVGACQVRLEEDLDCDCLAAVPRGEA